jgi:hypothetical protein
MDGTERAESPTPLRLGEVSVYFKFVFDVGQDVDPVDAAARLLETDMGVGAVWQDEVWDAARLRDLKRNLDAYRDIQEAQRRLDDGVGGFFRYLAARPRLASKYVSAWWSARGQTDDDSRENDEDLQVDNGNPELTIEEIEASVAQASSLQKLLRLVDGELFNPDFLKDGSWVRIELQPAFCTKGNSTFAIDVWLLIHTSGTAVMTFAVYHDGPMSPSELVASSRADWFTFDKTELASWIVTASAQAHRGWEPVVPNSVRFSSGIEWSTWNHREAASMSDVFGVYQEALLRTLSLRELRRPELPYPSYATQWLCYPVVCIRNSDDRVFDLDDVEAQRQVGAFLARVGTYAGYRTAMLLNEAINDVSILEDQRSWINGGFAVTAISPARREEMATRYGGADKIPEQDWIWIEQQFAVPFDFLLLQYHSAQALLSQVTSLSLKAEDLHVLKARMLAVKSQFRARAPFAYGTLYSMERRFHEERGTDRVWAAVDESLELVDSVLAAEARAAADRRTVALEFALGIVAVVLGIPAVHRIVEILSGVQAQGSDSWLGFGRLIDLATSTARDHSGALVVSSVAVLAMLVVVALRMGGRRRRHARPLMTRASGRPARREPFKYFSPDGGITWIVERRDEAQEDRTESGGA